MDFDDLPMTPENATFDHARARRAARDRRRPGEGCGAPAGSFAPAIDLTRCEAKGECIAVCPYGVFEVRRMSEAEFRSLPFLARLRSRIHGRRAAHATRAASCRACGLCVVACPENAITLSRREAR